ncbi:MAG: fasciclin domain-containing protein [Duncaniella sp.]|nr:fasciclin domain-containing protein [Duncaniella sp.]
MIRKILTSVLAGGACILAGCSDSWDDHFTDKAETEGRTSVLDEIKADPELSKFAAMIEAAGYSELLGSTQTFTIWAPVNAALADVDLTDKAAVTRTLINHIARFNISSATRSDEGVKMLNGKLMYFSADAAEFGGVHILQSDIIAANGLIHKLDTTIPYAYNFREYIDTHSNTSSIAAFLARFDEVLPLSQVPGVTGVSANDSTKVAFNRLLEYPVYGLGNIASEDSVFAMAIPDNTAWQKAYEVIKPYFATYNADPAVADSLQHQQTSLAIVNDLIFRTGLRAPEEMDSIVSTGGSVISSPRAYFSGMQQISASNGRLYLASELNYDMTETFNKPIRIEAEEQTGRTPAAGTTVYTRNVATDNEFADHISGQRYIEVFPASSSRQPGVTFEVPDILAGEYDIYATFVPASIADASNTSDSTRVQFALSYMNADGRTQSKAFNDKDFLTSGTRMTTIKVASGFKFPVANYYDRVWFMNPKNDPNDRVNTTTIYVSTNVTNAEFNQNVLSRRFRIDRLVFVPVKAD